ncbi:MAG: hypothetical protein HY927_16535 [Elusimicrobia bacterium]|nr:hypothetical protein [Elusimicrobiota bacterium]
MSGAEAGRAGRRTVRLVFAAVLGVYAAANALWLGQNGERCIGFPFHARHFLPAMDQYDRLEKGAPFLEFLASLREDRWRPAPAHSFVTALGFLLVGKDVALVTGVLNLAYLALALLFLPAVASRLGYPPAVAAWAMVLFALYPAVYGLSRLYGAFDFQVMAVMPVAVWCVLRTDGYRSRGATMVLAGVAAAGLLVKDTFAGYFAPVLLFTAVRSLRQSFERRKVVNLSLLAVVVAAAVSFYYAGPEIVYKELSQPFHDVAGPWHDFVNWGPYTVGLSEKIMSPVLFLLFLGSMAWAWSRPGRGQGFGVLAVWILASWALIFCMPHYKQPSYFVPILPAAAIVSAAGLLAIPPRPRRAAMAVVAGVGILQFASFSFGSFDRLRQVRLARLPGGRELTYFKLDPGIVYHRAYPVPSDLYRDVTARVAAMGRGRSERVLVLPALGAGHEYRHLYDLADWLHGWRFVSTGDFGEVLKGAFMDEGCDRVILPLKEGWDIGRTMDAVHREALHAASVSKANWTPETVAVVERADPRRLAARLERFLAPYTAKVKLGHDGESDLWLLSKPPPRAPGARGLLE